MELQLLARTACLSLAQVRELEQGADTGVFYSENIRRQAYKRLLLILGAEPPRAESVELPARPAHPTPLRDLDQIAAMSHLPSMDQSSWVTLAHVLQRLLKHKQVIAAAGLLCVASALMVWIWPQPEVAKLDVPVQEAPAPEKSASDGTVSESAPAASIAAKATTETVAAPSQSASAAPFIPAAGSCAFTPDALPEVSASVASKTAGYVYFVSSANVTLCVVDSHKQATLLTLKAGESRSVYGAAPWQVSSTGLTQVQIFFQGWRVALPTENTQRMTLVEKPMQR
jgi:hypothetical protein